MQSRSNYLLKNISGEGCGDALKPGGVGGGQDMEPMLVKRSASLGSYKSQQGHNKDYGYIGTWGHSRRPTSGAATPLSAPMASQSSILTTVAAECPQQPQRQHASNEDILNDQNNSSNNKPCTGATLMCRSPQQKLNVFTTFKPGEDPYNIENASNHIHQCFRTSDESPYYFKLDVMDKGEDGKDGIRIRKPDIVHGCLECQDRIHLQQQHSVV